MFTKLSTSIKDQNDHKYEENGGQVPRSEADFV